MRLAFSPPDTPPRKKLQTDHSLVLQEMKSEVDGNSALQIDGLKFSLKEFTVPANGWAAVQQDGDQHCPGPSALTCCCVETDRDSRFPFPLAPAGGGHRSVSEPRCVGIAFASLQMRRDGGTHDAIFVASHRTR